MDSSSGADTCAPARTCRGQRGRESAELSTAAWTSSQGSGGAARLRDAKTMAVNDRNGLGHRSVGFDRGAEDDAGGMLEGRRACHRGKRAVRGVPRAMIVSRVRMMVM